MITSINENYKFYTEKEEFYFKHRMVDLNKYDIVLYNLNNVPVRNFSNIRVVDNFSIEEYLKLSIRVMSDFVNGMYKEDREYIKNIF